MSKDIRITVELPSEHWDEVIGGMTSRVRYWREKARQHPAGPHTEHARRAEAALDALRFALARQAGHVC